tara:strand:+ start:504 stop:2138 length:1635 start_codon:yes stop_codon:yes gene_type:complete
MSLARLMQQAAAGSAGAGPAPSGWTDPDLANASYDSVSFSVSAQDTSAFGLTFKPDGTKMYMSGAVNDSVFEYDLSSAWDISTSSYLQSFSVSAQAASPYDVTFKSDGTRMFVVDLSSDNISQYDLGTAWDISTASYLSQFNTTTQDNSPIGFFFKPDGTKMYVLGISGDSVYEYDLSSAWDVTTASFLQSFSVSAQEGNGRGIFFSPNGDKLFLVGLTGDTVFEYDLTTAWDISSASYSTVSFSVNGQDGTPTKVFFKIDGTKMYILGDANNSVFQYSTAAPAPASWTDPDLANASYDSVSFSVAAQDSLLRDVFFNPDGTQFFTIGSSFDNVYQYDLSTAWDLSSTSYTQSLSVSAKAANPFGLHIGNSGQSLYIVNFNDGNVHRYVLSTAWDISTATFSETFDLTQDDQPDSIYFKADGTKMYLGGSQFDNIYECDLSTAWDLSTASYVQSFSTATQDGTPHGLFFNPDGTKMFVMGGVSDTVFEYDLSTAWDISTASYNSVSFSVSTQASVPEGVAFKSDGSKMYVADGTTDTIYQYSTA